MGTKLNKQSTVTIPEDSAIRQEGSESKTSQHIHRGVDLNCPLIESQHDPNDLARELSRILRNRGNTLTPAQRTLLKEYRAGGPNYYIGVDPKIPEEIKVLAYSNLFNVLIFQGQLTRRVTIELNPRPGEEWDGETGVQDGYAIITLWSQDHVRDPKVRLLRYLGIALHELTNAYLATFGCLGCRWNLTWQGEVDHGEAWKDMMVAIQEAVEDGSFLDLDLKLGGLGIPT